MLAVIGTLLAAFAALKYARFARDRYHVFREVNRALGRTVTKRG